MGYRDGAVEYGYHTYEDMQEAVRKAYMSIADELSLSVSTVGLSSKSAYFLQRIADETVFKTNK